MLPFLKKSAPASQRQYLFALEISPQTVKSAVWSVINDQTQVLAVGASATWDDKSEESLISACDQTLSDATSHLDPSGKVAVNEVILGLPPEWVERDKIRLNRLALLKRLAQDLELKPVGFVVTAEAVVKYLHHSEGVPPTAILLGFWPSELEVTLVRMGKVDGTEIVKRSSDLGSDVVEGLSRFPNVDVMPSRMLLYDSGLDLEETKQQLLQHPWQAPQKKLPFLHFPKVEILPSDFTVRAIALAGGTEVARAIGLLSPEVESDLGFVPDVDIRTVATIAQPAIETAEPVSGPPQPTEVKPRSVTWPKFKFSAAAIWGGLLALVVTLGLGYWYLPKAEVMVFVKPQNFQADFTMVADTSLDRVDVGGKAIPARELTVEVTANKTIPTTGSQLVGDKATGSVIISNALDSSRSLAAGTGLTSPSGLKFILNEAVTVASASGSAGNLTPGKATAAVMASSIGGDYNLAAGTVFRVGSHAITQLDAKNDIAFSGGSSRQAQAVAQEDVTSLRSQLTAELKSQAESKLTEQIADGQTVIAESITTETISQDFNHKVGEEATEVTLSLTVKATGIVVSKSDLQAVVDAQIKPSIPPGYTSVAQLEQSFAVTDTDADQVSLQVSVSAQLLPAVDQEDVIKKIRGRRPERAREYLQGLPAASQIDITITPRLPAFLTVLPRVSRNISLSIQPFE